MARPSPSCAHDDDRLHFSPASPPSSNSSEKKESTGPRLSQLCPPCATPSSSSSLDYRRSDAHIVENGFAERSVVSKSAKVVLVSPMPISKGKAMACRIAISFAAAAMGISCIASDASATCRFKAKKDIIVILDVGHSDKDSGKLVHVV